MERYFSHAAGYVRVKIDGRFVLEHRYVMEKHLGRKLRPDEIVHHVDENKANNDLSNLEILSPHQHSQHHGDKRRVVWIELSCPVCEELFLKEPRRYKRRLKEGGTIYCSRSCAGIAARKKQLGSFI